MRNIIIFGFVLALASCAMPAEEVNGVGFFTPLPEETFITGSDEITEIWTQYLDAHNNGDIEAIKSMSADSIYILGPDGTEIRTKEEQAELAKHELLILWTDYFKPVHLEAYPDLHEVFWNAAKTCSVVFNLTPFFSRVVPRWVSITYLERASISGCPGRSILLKTYPVFSIAGLKVKVTLLPV